MFDVIFLSAFVAGWLVCATLPWLGFSVATRGNAGLATLPLCLFAGVVGALAVPLLGKDDLDGLWLSFVVAFAVPLVLMAVRQFAGSALGTQASSAAREPGDR